MSSDLYTNDELGEIIGKKLEVAAAADQRPPGFDEPSFDDLRDFLLGSSGLKQWPVSLHGRHSDHTAPFHSLLGVKKTAWKGFLMFFLNQAQPGGCSVCSHKHGHWGLLVVKGGPGRPGPTISESVHLGTSVRRGARKSQRDAGRAGGWPAAGPGL